MCHSHRGAVRAQVNFLRRQFLQDGDLPFTNVLTEEVIAQALTAITGWLDRVFSPLVTLWGFLGQVLSADHSCRAAVARLIAHRLAQGQCPCSAETGASCQARQRLPESFFADMARQTDGTGPGRRGPAMAVERSARLPVRWHDRNHAGHPRESRSLSASLQSAAGRRLSDRAGNHLIDQQDRVSLNHGNPWAVPRSAELLIAPRLPLTMVAATLLIGYTLDDAL
jgi:hypothetical protein